MKIMFYAWGLGKGGAERVISVLTNEFSKQHDVSIVINSKDNIAYNINKNVTIYELDNKKAKNKIVSNLFRIINTKKIFKQVLPDVIICFLPVPSFRALLCKGKISSKIIVCDRNDPKVEYAKIINKTLMKLLYKHADGFVFQTNEQKNFFDSKIQSKSIIIRNPLKEEFLADTNLKNRDNIIVNVGRLHQQKNQKLLIDAFKNISDKFNDYELRIFGDGPLHAELANYIKSQGLSRKVKLCGISDNIRDELIKSKVFVLSSNYEGMPNALIEAMATGLACIATDCPCGGPRDLIENNVNGLLVKCNDVADLTEKLELLLLNPKKIEQFGNNASKIRKILATSIIVKEWLDYIDVINNK